MEHITAIPLCIYNEGKTGRDRRDENNNHPYQTLPNSHPQHTEAIGKMMVPLSGTSTGSAGKASPHLQAWLDEKKAAEEKRRALEGKGEKGQEKEETTMNREGIDTNCEQIRARRGRRGSSQL